MQDKEKLKQFIAKLKEMRANHKPNPELAEKHREFMKKIVERIKAKRQSNINQ